MITSLQLEEFWKKSLNQPVLEIYEETMQLFSQELPEEFWEEYAWDELVLEVFAGLERTKEFRKALNFIALLQEKHPIIFDQLYFYFDEFQIQYFLYHQKTEALQEPVNRFISDPAEDVGFYLKVFHLITYYQQEELTERMSAPAVYQALETTEDEEEEGYGIELSGIRYYLEVRNQYRLYQKTGSYQWKPIQEKLLDYEFEVSPDYLKDLAEGLSSVLPNPAALQKLFSENFSKCLLQLEGHFLKAMDDKGFSMLAAGVVWDMLKEFWLVYNLPKNKSGKLLFSFAPSDYHKFVNSKGVFEFMDMGSDVAALLWGTQLVYDFLFECGIISEKIHQNMLHSLLEEKGVFIADYQTEIWAFRFVHDWPRPDSMNDAQWEIEKETFRRSYDVKERHEAPHQHLLKGLDPQNPLVISIEKGYQNFMTKNEQQHALLKQELSRMSRKSNDTSERLPPTFISPEEHARRQKVGRNEPCPCGSGKKFKKCCGS